MADKIQRMKELSGILTEAGKAYYQEGPGDHEQL